MMEHTRFARGLTLVWLYKTTVMMSSLQRFRHSRPVPPLDAGTDTIVVPLCVFSKHARVRTAETRNVSAGCAPSWRFSAREAAPEKRQLTNLLTKRASACWCTRDNLLEPRVRVLCMRVVATTFPFRSKLVGR